MAVPDYAICFWQENGLWYCAAGNFIDKDKSFYAVHEYMIGAYDAFTAEVKKRCSEREANVGE